MENKKRKKHLKSNVLSFKALFFRCFAFVFVFTLIYFIITLIFSYFLYKTKDPTSLIKVGSTISLLISIFLSGFLLSKYNRKRYLISSLILGTLILLLIALINVFFFQKDFTLTDFIWQLLIPVFCILGGAIGVKKEKRKKIHR